jgi:hypothetical protein
MAAWRSTIERKTLRRMRWRVILDKAVLDRIQPRGGGRDEVEGSARMAGAKPALWDACGWHNCRAPWIGFSARTSRSTVLRKRMNSMWR